MTDCRGCGQPIERSKPTDRRVYHSLECRPRCEVEGCAAPVTANGWCSPHARRAIRTGNPVPEVPRNRNAGECSVVGCDQPMRKRMWCAGHYSMWKRTGDVKPFTYRWTPALDGCLVCGGTVGQRKQSRRFCSAACDQLWRRHGGERPTEVACIQCGCALSLADSTGVQRRRSDTKTCARCRQDRRKHGMSVGQLAARDGTDCGICHEAVDMAAAKTDKMRPSIDHIWPRARGGTNAPANLQLAHLLCNQLKKDHVPDSGRLGATA